MKSLFVVRAPSLMSAAVRCASGRRRHLRVVRVHRPRCRVLRAAARRQLSQPDPRGLLPRSRASRASATSTTWSTPRSRIGPAFPIHESTDLVHWTLIGHALTDPAKISFDGSDISRGVFAPSIHFHDGTFYIINTLVDAGGNFFVTAKDPRGPWSDPVWLKEIDGIDPSFFFDDGWQGIHPQQRTARGHAAVQRPSRHLDPGVRRRGQQARRVRARSSSTAASTSRSSRSGSKARTCIASRAGTT